MACALCEKRPPKRFCPAKGENICPVCCGREREITIDCPTDCPHLIAAHRYEAEHPKPVATDNLSYRDVQMRPDFVYEHWDVVSSLATTILQFQLENKETNDSTAAIAIEALAETFRTLGTGIYYERPPDFPLGRALYVKLGEFIQQYRKEKAARAGFGTLSDSAIFHLLVFLLRVARQETNGRPRSRAFLGFLQARFPLSATPDKEPSRIIVP